MPHVVLLVTSTFPIPSLKGETFNATPGARMVSAVDRPEDEFTNEAEIFRIRFHFSGT